MLEQSGRGSKQGCYGQGSYWRPHAGHQYPPVPHLPGIELEGGCQTTLCSRKRHQCCGQHLTANQHRHLHTAALCTEATWYTLYGTLLHPASLKECCMVSEESTEETLQQRQRPRLADAGSAEDMMMKLIAMNLQGQWGGCHGELNMSMASLLSTVLSMVY